MSLTTRLLLFFQAALAAILLAVGLTLYLAARGYVQHQATESVERAAATLVASVDIEPDSVEWEPSDRDVSLGPGPLGGTIYWYLTDARGELIGRAPQPGTAEVIAAAGTDTSSPPLSGDWLLARRLVHPPGASGAQLVRDRTSEEVEKGEYPALVFTVGVRKAPFRTALNTLAAGLFAVSLAVWLLAFAGGRWVCRRALRPLTNMAAAARQMRADDAEARLPRPGARGELDELHAAISGLLARLREALGRERRFTGEASHQLRTPLATILGQVEVALRRPRSPEEYERVLGVVRRQAADLIRSVEALLFLARSEADAPPPPTELIDLREWLPAFVESLAANPRHADLSCDVQASEPLWVSAHPPLLRELVGNLIDNALKYSPLGSPVGIRLGADGGRVALSVEDRGPGIDPADLAHVFEPFFRSAKSAGVPGSGLGLAVAARVAAAFGGGVSAKNREGGGTRFTLTLPRRQDEAEFILASRSS